MMGAVRVLVALRRVGCFFGYHEPALRIEEWRHINPSNGLVPRYGWRCAFCGRGVSQSRGG